MSKPAGINNCFLFFALISIETWLPKLRFFLTSTITSNTAPFTPTNLFCAKGAI